MPIVLKLWLPHNSNPFTGLFAFDRFCHRLNAIAGHIPIMNEKMNEKEIRCFVIMPYDETYDDY
jgi:hypothetical protein